MCKAVYTTTLSFLILPYRYCTSPIRYRVEPASRVRVVKSKIESPKPRHPKQKSKTPPPFFHFMFSKVSRIFFKSDCKVESTHTWTPPRGPAPRTALSARRGRRGVEREPRRHAVAHSTREQRLSVCHRTATLSDPIRSQFSSNCQLSI